MNAQFSATITRKEAVEVFESLPSDTENLDALITTLDEAQGAAQDEDVTLVITIKKGDL